MDTLLFARTSKAMKVTMIPIKDLATTKGLIPHVHMLWGMSHVYSKSVWCYNWTLYLLLPNSIYDSSSPSHQDVVGYLKCMSASAVMRCWPRDQTGIHQIWLYMVREPDALTLLILKCATRHDPEPVWSSSNYNFLLSPQEHSRKVKWSHYMP